MSAAQKTAESAAARRCCEQMLRPFWEAVETGLLESGSLGGFLAGGRGYEIHRFTLFGAADGNTTVRIGLFATIHGDEPQGAAALVELAKVARAKPEMFRGYEVQLYPLCNPTGYEDGTRHSRRGEDLNRHFWRGSSEPEVAILEREITEKKFHGIVSLQWSLRFCSRGDNQSRVARTGFGCRVDLFTG